MGTSLGELVDDLEHRLHSERVVLRVDEAAGGLHAIGMVLRRLAADGLDRRVAARRKSAVTALASACERAGQAWPTDPAGRTGQLVGIIGDLIGLQRFQLGCEARWWTTLRLASAARATADVIAASGPYADHPYLKQVRAASTAVQQLGAASPPGPGPACRPWTRGSPIQPVISPGRQRPTRPRNSPGSRHCSARPRTGDIRG